MRERKKERKKDRKIERQKDRKIERQKDRKKERKKERNRGREDRDFVCEQGTSCDKNTIILTAKNVMLGSAPVRKLELIQNVSTKFQKLDVLGIVCRKFDKEPHVQKN